VTLLLLAAVSIAFFVSASAGLGGSLVLVPIMTLALGAKQGISTAALLLAGNNLVKLWAYRKVLPVRSAASIALCALAGASLGARLLISAPEGIVSAAVIASCGAALVTERRKIHQRRRSLALGLAFAAKATSGFSGTSGPLKGVAIRSLGLDRMQTVGAAALVSTAADVAKTAVFARAGLLDPGTLQLAMAAIPLMFVATLAGRHFTDVIGEKGYTGLFWLIIGGYTVRLLLP
jgi:uncharacterized membrane protein YfcA